MHRALPVALAGLLLLLGDAAAIAAEGTAPIVERGNRNDGGRDPGRPIAGPADVTLATEREAEDVARAAWEGFVDELPKLLVALAALLVAWGIVRAIRRIVRRFVPVWSRANAIIAVVGFLVWLVAGGIAASVVAGDIRGMLGSVGLVGLALSWALQTPIESATGWLLNSFRGYYRVGDRIAVGDVQGDVYRIDVLTTTLWEIGGPRHGNVAAEQPTGRMITFPNHEILTGTVVNFTRLFPWVWDEVSIPVATESDLGLAARTALRAAEEAIGARMREPAIRYGEILREHGLEQPIAVGPEVFLAHAESWTTVTVRYLVPTHERRLWKSELTLRITEALHAAALEGRVWTGYPRRQWQHLDAHGHPRD